MLVIGVILEIQNVQNSNVMLNMFVISFLHFVLMLVLKPEVFHLISACSMCRHTCLFPNLRLQ